MVEEYIADGKLGGRTRPRAMPSSPDRPRGRGQMGADFDFRKGWLPPS